MRSQGELLVRVAAFVLVVELAVGCSLVSVFSIPTGPLVGGVDLSLSWPLVVVLNVGLVKLTARLDRWRWTPLVAVLVWLAVTLFLSTSRREGDILIVGNSTGFVFLLLGALSAGVAASRELSRRGSPRGSGSGSGGAP